MRSGRIGPAVRWAALAAALAIALALLPLPTGERVGVRGVQGAPSRSPAWKSTLIIAVSDDPQTFDAAVNVAAVTAYRMYPNLYESLVQYGPDGSLRPMLAQKWEIRDNGLTYRFQLAPNVKFSDGTDFNAEAVKFSIERFLGIGKGLISAYSAVKEVRAVEPLVADIVLKEPFAPLLAILASWYGGIFVSPTAVRANERGGDRAQAWLHNHSAGTGPYMLESWQPANRIVYVKNPHYRGGWKPGQIQRVIYKVVREPSTLRQQVVGGDVDMAEEIVPSLVAPLRSSPEVTVSINTTHGSSYGQSIEANQTKAPFNNVDFRRAIAYAIDYQRLLPVWQGVATLAEGPFPPTFTPWFSRSSIVRYSHNPEKARTHLERAGYKTVPISPPLQFEAYWQQGQTAQRDMLDLIREDLARYGIQLSIKETPLPVWREAIWSKKFDIVFVQLPLRYNDPDSLASLSFHSSEIRYRGFNPGYKNARVDELIRLGRTTINPTARLQFYREFQHIVTDEAAIWHLVNKQHAFAYRKEVEGIQWNPNYGPHFRAYEMNKNPNPK